MISSDLNANKRHHCFLSVVVVVQKSRADLEDQLRELSAFLFSKVLDHEIIVIDNASDDGVLDHIEKKLIGARGIDNVRVLALAQKVRTGVAYWVGMENSIGDYVVALDIPAGGSDLIAEMLGHVDQGADVVFAVNNQKKHRKLYYRVIKFIFNKLYKFFNKYDLSNDAPEFRLLSRAVINYVSQCQLPHIAYRHLPAVAGFKKKRIFFDMVGGHGYNDDRFFDSVEQGISSLVSSSNAPLRLLTFLSMFGAIANLIYSAYVVLVLFFKDSIADGWASLSLQQSGMFFLISLVLWVLGEYLVQVVRGFSSGPLYFIAKELSSARLTHKEKLNIEES